LIKWKKWKKRRRFLKNEKKGFLIKLKKIKEK